MLRNRLLKPALVAGLFAGLAALLGGAQPAEAGGNFILKRFLLGRIEPNTDRFIGTGGRGTTNAFRDNVVMLVFSEPVAFSSLDPRSVQIGIPSGPGLFLDAEGEFYPYVVSQLDDVSGTYVPKRTYVNRVIFDPTKRKNPIPALRNPYGFGVNSLYRVTLPGIDQGATKTVRSSSGKALTQTFTTTFRTSDRYLQDYTQPNILSVEGGDAPGTPLDGRSGVDSRADVVINFSEPMLPSAFDPNTTFTVYNNGQARYVTGTIRASPDGRTFIYRPVFGYGRGPYSVTVRISSTLTDRSGNPLDKGALVNFTSEFDPTAPNYNEKIETFDTGTFEDTTYTPVYDKALWNKPGNQGGILGSLVGTFGSKSLDIVFSSTGGFAFPWYSLQVHCQNLYSPGHMGNTARTITGFAWRYYTGGAPVAGNYPATIVQMGHNTSANLNTNFTGSFSDTPVTVSPSATYTVPSGQTNWITGPAYTVNWSYNGRDHVVIDISQTGGTAINYWSYVTSAQGGTTMVATYNNGTTYNCATWNHDMRWFYQVDKSEAQSKWYDIGVANAAFLDPVITQTVPAGTVSTLIFQGTRESTAVPGQPDPAAMSAWTPNPAADLPNYRFVRFKADFTANIPSSTRPQIDEIRLPFIFY